MDPAQAVQHLAQSPNYILEFTYLVASILFIFGLKGLSHPDTARRGMFLAEGGMAAAIIGTLFHHDIQFYGWIIAGLILGSLVGAAFAIWVPMTAMPQRTALSHAFGAIAASLVGIAEFLMHADTMSLFTRSALGLEVMLGSLTTTGSLIACGKLQGVIRGTPVQFKGQQYLNLLIFASMAGCFGYSLYNPAASYYFYGMVAFGLLFGVMLVIPIGSADMPVVMSLLNSYAGLSSAATGFVMGNNILIIAGTLDGFSGFILSILMCKAMNRSITNVLFGGFGAVRETAASGGKRGRCTRSRWMTLPCGWPMPARSSSCPATAWPRPRRSTRYASWPTRSKNAASPLSTVSIPWPDACQDT